MQRPLPFSRRPAEGVALVLVLLSLAFITALILAFFLSTTTELQSSKSYADGSNSQLLADSAVNLVTAQIQNATVTPVDPDPASAANAKVAWISQPGLLRTFGDDGNALKSYKLYSSDSMIVDGSFDPAAQSAAEVPADWSSRPAQFTDLNAPVVKRDASGKKTSIYPIVDGNALTLATAGGGLTYDADDANGQSTPDGFPDVQGFSVTRAPTAAPDASGAVNPVPMPVRWLYELRDGTLASLDDTGQLRTNKASRDNPVVARLAFWTDDETCKVNVNTAAGDEWNNTTGFGSFCDTPHATVSQEVTLSQNQPAQHEFQRYPGHPATNYLSAVFPFLTESLIADLSPRVTYNKSSRGGTTSAGGVMATDADRLYATVDELLFKADRNTNAIFRPAQLNRSRFFLTAQSRAPDLNLLNQPRVTIWPEAANSNARTAFDNQIAFCSTVGTGNNARPYYFVRGNPRSATADYANQPRNQKLYAYLQAMLARTVPGFGGRTLAKYTLDQDQILTEIFDYIRCANLTDTTNSSPYTPAPPGGQRAVNAPPGVGHVVPIEIADTRGFGRTTVIYSPVVQFYAQRVESRYTKQMGVVFLLQTFCVGDGVTRYKPDLKFEVTGLDQFQVNGQSLAMPADATTPFETYAYLDENGSGNVQGFNDLFFSYAGTSDTNHKNISAYPFRSKIINVNNRITDYRGMLFAQYNVPDPISFKGGTVKVSVSVGGDPTPIQTYAFTFPDTTLYPPYIGQNNLYDFGTFTNDYNSRAYERLSNVTPAGDYLRALEPATGDMRLVAATHAVPAAAYQPQEKYFRPPAARADGLRANAGIANRDPDIYPVPSNPNAGDRGPFWGKLVSTVYGDADNNARGPVVPSFVATAQLNGSDNQPHPGDWDTAMGDLPDGGLINKPDEGESGSFAYYSYANQPANSTLFSPNRQMPSAVMFGSLSTGVKASQQALLSNNTAGLRPWQTLLFCPNPPAGNQHPGFGEPLIGPPGPGAQPPYKQSPDHLLLDLFTMPVVEPYAISEPFSTAGKVNLNYQIAPFTYLARKTALESALRSARVTAIPTGDGNRYKGNYADPAPDPKYRLPLDLDETLNAFDTRFAANTPFRSASQICEMFLVPKGQTAAATPDWWNNYRLTGDNLREQPYSALYGRLTTRSNTFTVHVRAQTLLKSRSDPRQNVWNEARDQITGEYRSSVTIERYLDPNDPRFGSSATDGINPDQQSLNPAYRFRSVNTKQFAP